VHPLSQCSAYIVVCVVQVGICLCPIVQVNSTGWIGTTNSQNHPFHLGHVNPHVIRQCLGQPTLLTSSNNSLISARTSTQLCNEVPAGYNGKPQIHPQNCPFPFDDITRPPSNASISRPIQLTIPNGIHIHLLFCHNTLCRQTHRPIDRRTDQQMVHANVRSHKPLTFAWWRATWLKNKIA